MVTILGAGIDRGYSREDHFITGFECTGLIGREFRSVAQARKACVAMARKNAWKRGLGPPWIRVLLPSGEIVDC